MAMVDMDGSSH